jgi:putative transcriptional regulator
LLPNGGATLRHWLITARKRLKLTHQEVADQCEIKRQYYGMIEKGERTPSVPTAKKIAKTLNVSWTLFFEDKSNKTLRKYNSA